MTNQLDHYRVVAERETGFWINVPVRTGNTVSREEWLRLHQADPDHFQIVALSLEAQLPHQYSNNDLVVDVVIEHAIFVMWSDEVLH